jgi:uncharacterized damage-inducible protein DinB
MGRGSRNRRLTGGDMPEAWLSGPVPGVVPELMPAAHMLLHAKADLEAAAELDEQQVWARPGNAASIGYHLRHIAGSLDRLLTYARGEALSDAQRDALADEKNQLRADLQDLRAGAERALDAALETLRSADPKRLFEERKVGRAQLPSTVIGLLYHAAEHAARHAGQVVTLSKVVRGT